MSDEERRTFTLPAVAVEPAEEAWHAYCPTLLDDAAATWGTTREEALEQIRAVVTMLVERMAPEEKMPVLTDLRDPVPTPIEQVVVTVRRPDRVEPRQGLATRPAGEGSR